jgi:hypothetical protein
MRPTKLPRITAPGEPARARFHSDGAEWTCSAWPKDDGFFVQLRAVKSKVRLTGTEIFGHYPGDWITVKENLRFDLAFLEQGIYDRFCCLEHRDEERAKRTEKP